MVSSFEKIIELHRVPRVKDSLYLTFYPLAFPIRVWEFSKEKGFEGGEIYKPISYLLALGIELRKGEMYYGILKLIQKALF